MWIKGFPLSLTTEEALMPLSDMTGGKAGGAEAYQAVAGKNALATDALGRCRDTDRFPEWLRELSAELKANGTN